MTVSLSTRGGFICGVTLGGVVCSVNDTVFRAVKLKQINHPKKNSLIFLCASTTIIRTNISITLHSPTSFSHFSRRVNMNHKKSISSSLDSITISFFLQNSRCLLSLLSIGREIFNKQQSNEQITLRSGLRKAKQILRHHNSCVFASEAILMRS